jgi:AraC-like DNA-binding protein
VKDASRAPAPGQKIPTENIAARAQEWLDRVLVGEYWRDPELTLPALSDKMQMGQAQVSRLLNAGLCLNFNEVINRLRIDAVAECLRDTAETRDILAIALDCGFNSKASFNRAFKRYMDRTPTDYRRHELR